MLGEKRGLKCLAALLLCALGCGGEPVVPADVDVRDLFNLTPLGPIPYPPDNPRTEERIHLGRLLFFDPILSGERDVACGTCHHPDFGFADGRQFGAGVSGVGLGPGRVLSVSTVSGNPISLESRNTQTVLNTAYAADVTGAPSPIAPMFWDGRAVGLEGQAIIPIAFRVEMRGDAFPGTDAEAAAVAVDSIVQRLRAIPEYVQLFATAFPDDVGSPDTFAVVNGSTLARAIAAYERELVTADSPYDRFLNGDDAALSPIARQGLELFFTKAKCFICHRGPMLSNYQFLVTGVTQAGVGKTVIPGDDTGREEHTGDPDDRYEFRVPTLRNVDRTAPYMHSGVFTDLEEVVRFYNDGARPRHARVADDMLEVVLRQPLGLTDPEIAALVAFLRSLTGEGSDLDSVLMTVPATVPSGLAPVFGLSETTSHP